MRRALVAFFLAVLVGVGIAVVLLRGGSNALGGPLGFGARSDPVAAETSISPRVVLFGDTVTAAVDIVFSRRRVQANSLRVVAEFAPWGVLGPPVRERHDSQGTTYLRTTYTLRCVIGPCVPERGTASREFDPVKVTYRRADGSTRAASTEARWPVLVVHSQIVSDDFLNPAAVASPWRADVVSLPAVSYRLSPGLARVIALAVGILFVLAAMVFAVLAIPGRAPRPEPEPEPEPVPVPLLPPLEHALVLLEADGRLNGSADQRRALELVAEEMELRGEQRLARKARGMAWSEDVPACEETRGMAAQVRAAIAEDESAAEEEGDDAPPR